MHTADYVKTAKINLRTTPAENRENKYMEDYLYRRSV